MDDLTFETALSQLEETVARLEAGDLTLEQSLALYERGQQLSAFCAGQLEQARLRVELLSADGELVTLDPPDSND
jgi:exodeoxyribonuclease VII small subunit